MSRLLIFFTFFLIALSACRSSRLEKGEVDCKLSKITYQELRDSMQPRVLDFDWMSVRAKMDYDDGIEKQSFTANIRMRTDSILWVLFSGTLSYEGARALITADSMTISNRLEKIYHHEPFEEISRFIPFTLDLGQLQDVVVGNPMHLDENYEEVLRKDCHYVIEGSDPRYEWTYYINPENYTVSRLRLKDKLRYRELIASFDNYEDTGNGMLAMTRDFEVTVSGNTIDIHADLSRLKLDEPVDFPFRINPNYEKVELE